MKQIIPFEKEIIFKKKIKDLISISLDNDLILKNNDLISVKTKGRIKIMQIMGLTKSGRIGIGIEVFK